MAMAPGTAPPPTQTPTTPSRSPSRRAPLLSHSPSPTGAPSSTSSSEIEAQAFCHRSTVVDHHYRLKPRNQRQHSEIIGQVPFKDLEIIGILKLIKRKRAVLEPAMEGRDMIGRAITGSRKTLAFGIPILDKIIRHQSQHRKKRVPSALVLAPTHELARQVQQEFKVSAPNLSSTCLYGGISISNQVRTLGFGMDIVVGTPGRIIDLVERGAFDLSEVKFVVLDEADQMLAIGFQEDVECILSYLPARKQFMLFSATMPSWVNDLSRKYLKNPLVVEGVGATATTATGPLSL